MFDRTPGLCRCFLLIVGGLLLAGGFWKTQAAPPVVEMPGSKFLPASDHRYRLEGRFDLTDPDQPVVIWAGCRIGVYPLIGQPSPGER